MAYQPPKIDRVPFSNRRPIDPRRANISIDGNVFNRGAGHESDSLIDRLEQLEADGTINFVMAGGIRDEVLNPATPARKQEAVQTKIFNLRPGLNSDQRKARGEVAAVLQGNAKPETHAADASHLSEAAETGCCYFITHDERIIKKRSELAVALPPTLQIVTLREFLGIFDDYVSSALI
jgi:hypothetical protein